MDTGNRPRHTRRGIIRETLMQPYENETVDVCLPVDETDTDTLASWFYLDPAPQAPVRPASLPVSPPEAKEPEPKRLFARLADEITDQAKQTPESLRSRRLLESMRAVISQENVEVADPYLDGELAHFSYECETIEEFDLAYDIHSAREFPEDESGLAAEYKLALRSRARPQVEMAQNGQRIETFQLGTKVTKDALGRVIEVKSQYGESLYLHYGSGGALESCARTDVNGKPISLGRLERHGVVVRDQDGRVRAAGQSMSVDPWGGFYVHTDDGQFFSLDLVSGMHIERRRLPAGCASKFMTAVFAHDGFRMAVAYTPSGDPEVGGDPLGDTNLRFRFYGRDGTLIEFDSEDALKELRPSKVLPPGSRPVDGISSQRRQAATAWQSVKEYLTQVS